MTTPINPQHTEMLLNSAITQEVLDVSGIRSTPTGLEFPWSDGVGATVWQKRPDSPRLDEDGKPVKYLFPKGAKVPLNKLRDGATYTKVIVSEGTKQSYAVLSHAPADFAVYGLSGCWGFRHADLTVVDGRDVFLLLDADMETNPDVYAAAEQFTKQLKLNGAKSVAYVPTTGTEKQGVDDVLAELPADRRAQSLRTWLANSPVKLPRRPKAKQVVEGDAAGLFRVRDKPIHYQPFDGATEILARFPAAVTKEAAVALYADGVYSVDPHAVTRVVAMRLKNYYVPAYVKSTTDLLRSMLETDGLVLPERATEPLLNCVNGMVDLRTGALLPHDPKYLSYVQVSVPYEPDMATPVYDAWLAEAVRQEGAGDADVVRIIDGAEEAAGTMLDPSATPSKALFLFGPSRSGKSTFLRLLKAVAGAAYTSAVTLHELGTDPFATANLYGRMLNVAADLSSAHVSDLSKFKMALGEDLLQANRKYGQQFEFTNQALFAFSANELPTVSEASRAYVERMWPVEFPNSFAGREDKTLEAKLMAELPGILARWVRAYGRMLARGGYAAQDTATRTQFEAKSDRVVQFFQDMCTLTEAKHGQKLADGECTGRRATAVAFGDWAERNGGSKMGERAFFQRLSQIPGVVDVRVAETRARAFNVTVAASNDDSWDVDDTAAEQPQEAPDSNPWTQQPVEVPAELVDAVEDAFDCVTEAIELDGDRWPLRRVTAAPTGDPFAVDGSPDYFA